MLLLLIINIFVLRQRKSKNMLKFHKRNRTGNADGAVFVSNDYNKANKQSVILSGENRGAVFSAQNDIQRFYLLYIFYFAFV